MRVSFVTPQAQVVERQFRDDEGSDSYEHLWDVLDRICEDPAYAQKGAAWAKYVSTQKCWGSKIPGTDYTVYWKVEGDLLQVLHLLHDPGI